MSNTLTKLPSTVVRRSIGAARVPIAMAERVLKPADPALWPPVIAFEGFEATVKEFAGGLLHDDSLTHEGELLRTKLRRLRDAEDLEGLAERRREEAAMALDDRLETVEERRHAAERRSEQAKAATESEARARAERAEDEADAEKRRVARADAAERKGAAKQAWTDKARGSTPSAMPWPKSAPRLRSTSLSVRPKRRSNAPRQPERLDDSLTLAQRRAP